MKKIINNTSDVVKEMCDGIILAHPELDLVSNYRIIKKKNLNKDKVTLMSGGGSGHEPAHAGFVGEGLLDAAVCGDVFASPSQIQVYQGIKETAGNKGTLLIIKNYSGDMMNFQNAAFLASEDGITVDYVKVDDDIAVQDSLYTVGHRGVAGTIFVHKIAGAASQKGYELKEVKRLAQKAADNVKSIGFAFSSCTVPAKGSQTFELGEDEMEYGVGIHGEPGIRREKIVNAQELAARMILSLCNELEIKSKSKQRVAIIINGFGATPLMELYLLNNDVMRELAARQIIVRRALVGNFMTSIDMAGASLSILKLDDELEELLNEKCDAPALKINGPVEMLSYEDINFEFNSDETKKASPIYKIQTDKTYAKIQKELTLNNLIYILDAMSESIIKNEVPFCDLDAHAGDGDFGASIAKGFRELKRQWDNIIEDSKLSISTLLDTSSLIIMEHCGGASGPIWGSAFRAAGKSTQGKETLSVQDFAKMLQGAVDGIQAIGERTFGRGAVVGDKTLIDALVPCVQSWNESATNNKNFEEAFRAGAKAAEEGADKTKNIVARMGRAGTVGERSLGHPDAGAHGLGVIFTDISNAIE